MKLNAENARSLAVKFRELSIQVGDYRWDNYDGLTRAKRSEVEDLEWSLLNASSDMVTIAVGLDLDAAQTSVAKLRKVTNDVKKTIKKIQQVKDVIKLATAAVQLAAAITTQNPAAVSEALQSLSAQVQAISA